MTKSPYPFRTNDPSISGNLKIRTPQREAYKELKKFADENTPSEREVGIVLPVGCGKSGCITLTPFAFKSYRTLIVAPGVAIAQQLSDDFDPSNAEMFYQKCRVLKNPPYPEPAEIRGTTSNMTDLEEADVVITNIGQLQGSDNRWLDNFSSDFFDLIIFDEGHHNIAASWETLKNKFPNAKIVNFSATPLRSDGQLMAGRILYSYPVFQAIEEGFVKQLKAKVLNPRTLKYVRNEDEQEVEVTLEEVIRLGEDDSDFRRSIGTSKETLNTIVDASLRELDVLRRNTGEKRLKIIAAALNFHNCHQIVEAYKARGRRADYVHSRAEADANKKVMQKLENHDLDVIVQVRKLGEGFDHPFLSVAAIFSIFTNLSPFIQFVGRIMRVIKHNSPKHPLNQGVVVFHAGANIAQRWGDFQQYSEADQEYFDQLLPLEGLDFSSADELLIEPTESCIRTPDQFEVRSQSDVLIEEIPLIEDPDALEALRILQDKGFTPQQVTKTLEELQPIPVTKQRQRQAMRDSLDMRVKTETGKILSERGINPEGHDLDRNHLGKTNFVVLKSAIDQKINAFVGKASGKRADFTRVELERINENLSQLIEEAKQEVFRAE